MSDAELSMHDKLDRILATVERIEKKIASPKPAGGAVIADDRDLDGQYGDPVIRKDPPKWTGESYVGCRFSECSPEYLDSVAGFKLWQAQKDEASGDEEKQKKARYARKDAARAAGWANRIRNGWKQGAVDRVQEAFPGTTTKEWDDDNPIF